MEVKNSEEKKEAVFANRRIINEFIKRKLN